MVGKLNLAGDRQADLSVHGGVNKAVYAYPSEHYPFWKEEFPDMDMPWGSFGENFTTEGIFEDSIRVGDLLKIGSAEFQVTQPRFPCYKLGLKFGTQRMLKLFLKSKRSGFYLRVLKEGTCEAGDNIHIIHENKNSPTIESIVSSHLKNQGKRQLPRDDQRAI